MRQTEREKKKKKKKKKSLSSIVFRRQNRCFPSVSIVFICLCILESVNKADMHLREDTRNFKKIFQHPSYGIRAKAIINTILSATI